MTTTLTTTTNQVTPRTTADEAGTAVLTLKPSPAPRHTRLRLALTDVEAEFLRYHGYTQRRISALLHAGVTVDAVDTLARLAVGARARRRVTMALSTSGTSWSSYSLPMHPNTRRVLLAYERLSDVEMPAREHSVAMGLLRLLSEGEQPRSHEVYIRLSTDAWSDFKRQAEHMGVTARRLLRAVLAEAIADDLTSMRGDGSAGDVNRVGVPQEVEFSPLGRLGDPGSLPLGETYSDAQMRLQRACMEVLHEGGLHQIEHADGVTV